MKILNHAFSLKLRSAKWFPHEILKANFDFVAADSSDYDLCFFGLIYNVVIINVYLHVYSWSVRYHQPAKCFSS